MNSENIALCKNYVDFNSQIGLLTCYVKDICHVFDLNGMFWNGAQLHCMRVQCVLAAGPKHHNSSPLKRPHVKSKELLLFYLTCIRPVTEYACPVYHQPPAIPFPILRDAN